MKREFKKLIEASPEAEYAIFQIGEDDTGSVVDAKYCQSVTFPWEVGDQELTYSATEREERLWHGFVQLSEGDIVLAAKLNGRWWAIVRIA